MNFWCNTCGCYKGAQGADECAVDNHAIVPAKDREVKLSAEKPTTQGREWIAAKIEAERKILRKEIEDLKKVIHEIHGILDSVLHSAEPIKSMNTWLPIAIKDCRKALGLPVAQTPPLSEDEKKQLEAAGFTIWTPKIGDRVWVSGKTWSSAGTIIAWARDDDSVPWIKTDDGREFDARDLGSVRQLKDKDK